MPRFLRGLVLAGVLLPVGCGVGGNDARDVAEPPAITKAQLEAMVLPQAELGTIAKGLKPDEDAGPVGNVEAAAETVDPGDTGKSLRSAGRLGGYKVYYEGTNLAALKKQRGVFLVGTEVELLEDTVYAAQYLHKQLGDFQRFQGKQDDGSKLTRVASFDVTGVGDEAGGLLAASTLGKNKLWLTAVAFRRARIIGVAAVVRADRDDAQREARALAVKLDKRIQDVLSGRIAPQPAKTPAPATEVSFEGKETLPKLTMAPKDVAPGLVPVSEGATEGEDYVGYQRTFGDAHVGGSHLVSVRAETRLYESDAAAARAFREVARPASRQAFARKMAQDFADATNVRPTNVRVSPLPRLRRGTTGFTVTFELVGAKFRVASIFLRKGRMIESVNGACRAAAFDPNDLRPVADRAQARLVA